MKFNRIAVPLVASAVLAACGGGGGGDTSTGGLPSTGVNALTADSSELFAFAGDVKTLRIFATDLQGATVASPTLTWSSTSEAVATAAPAATPSTGTITTKAPGKTNVVASANGKSLPTPLTVLAPPTTVEAVKGVFPYVGDNGIVATYSDIEAAGNTARFNHFNALWAYMNSGAGILPANDNPPARVEFYFTRDGNALTNARGLCGVPAFTTPPTVGSLINCPDAVTNTDRWYYVAPSNPLSQDKAQMQHELAESFFERAVNAEETFAWLFKGSTLYHESGLLVGSTFSVTVASLKARLAADPTNNFVPPTSATVLLNAPYDGTALVTPIHGYSYAPAALLLFIAEVNGAALRTLIAEIAASSSTITTNQQAITRLLALTGDADTDALNARYVAWRTANAL